jgi:PAS domain S-box-containing protein
MQRYCLKSKFRQFILTEDGKKRFFDKKSLYWTSIIKSIQMSKNSTIPMHFSTRQFEILLSLYKSSFSNFASFEKLQETIVKSVSDGLCINRVSIWSFEDNILHCEKLYDANEDDFKIEGDLYKEDFPIYFDALQKYLAIAIDNVAISPYTTEILDMYFIPNGIKSMLDIPIWTKGLLSGVLCCEHSKEKEWSEQEISFVRSIVDIYSIFFEEFKKRKIEKKLIENQDRFKFISENISDGIYIVEDDKLVFTSKRYLEMIGMTEEEKLNFHNKDMFYLVHPDDVEVVKRNIYSAIEMKKPSIKYEHRCRRKDGTYMWREDIMNIHYDSTGRAFRAVTIARDISQEKELEIELEKNKKISDLQNKLLLGLYAVHVELSFIERVKKVISIAIEGLRLDRTSYWEIKKNRLVCKSLFDCTEEKFLDVETLDVGFIPKYINTVNNQLALVADDVYTNEATYELVDSYFKPLGITDTLDVPIRANGKFFGILCCEHRDDPRVWSENDISFARALADYLSLAIEEVKRKKAERKLLENRKKLEFISENTSDGIITIEKNKVTYVSPAFSKMSGYDLNFVSKLSVEELLQYLHPDDLIKIKRVIVDNLQKRAKKFTYEYRFLAANNEYYWREDSVSVLYKEDTNEYLKYLIISRDIHDRKVSELQIKENEQQFRLIFENSTDGFIVVENHKIKYVSPSYREMLGFSEEEVLDFPADRVYDLLHPEDRLKVNKIVSENLKQQKPTFTIEFRIKGADNKYHWREDLTNVIYNDDGSYSKYIINSRNIDERKAIEERLIESEKQLKLITENSSDGVAVIEDGKITYVSPSFSCFLGYQKEAYKKMTIQDIFANIHPDDVERVTQTVYPALERQEKEIKYEHRFKGNDGVYHWREDSANVIYDENGNYTKYIVITRDITERKESENEKNRLYQITQKQNEKLINFTHIVSHDIRSHTSNLSMILDLYDETNNPDEQKEYFKMLKQSTNKLSDTIFFLNETVAVQSGIKNEKSVLNLRKEIEKALVGINAVIRTNDAQINIDVDDTIEIVATQSYLESIIFNLLTNAIKYKSPSRKPVVSIIAINEAGGIKLTIEDNGKGIDLVKYKDKIFGMYKTFHGNPDAVGLGLFMVKNHIESLGGEIEVESKVDVGTKFILYFI